MGRLTLRLHPVDVWMFRETRYFAEATSDSRSEFPLPKTVAGALRTLLMRAARVDLSAVRSAMNQARHEASDESEYLPVLKAYLRTACQEACEGTWPVDATIAGPFLWRDGARWYPLPRSIAKTKDDEVVALKPAGGAVPRWNTESGRRPLFAGTDDPIEDWEQAYISEEDLQSFLAGDTPSKCAIERGLRGEFIADESRVGIGIEAGTGTVAESLIYSSTFLRLKDDAALEVDLDFSGEIPSELTESIAARPWLRLGGEGRVARVEVIDPPASPPKPGGEGAPLVYLATPALFEDKRWYPKDAKPLAAAVGSPQVFSGWDLAANLPMKARYAVPAGAVFFYESEDADALPAHATCVSDDPDDQAAGWGYCMRGVWS